jgi:hypothetical protein
MGPNITLVGRAQVALKPPLGVTSALKHVPTTSDVGDRKAHSPAVRGCCTRRHVVGMRYPISWVLPQVWSKRVPDPMARLWGKPALSPDRLMVRRGVPPVAVAE